MTNRDKQVQFRMPSELHRRLRIALLENNSNLADFFNAAAEEYLGINVADKVQNRKEVKGVK